MTRSNRNTARSQTQERSPKSMRSLLSKDSFRSVAHSAYAHKTGLLSTLIGGAMMYYGYRQKTALAHFARILGTSLFGRGVSRVPNG